MRFILFLLCLGVTGLAFAVPPPPVQAASERRPSQTPMPPDMQRAYAQLAEFSKRRIGLIRTNILPSESRKDIIQTASGYIARYLIVDTDSVSIDITPAKGAGATYIGSIIYYEHVFESWGTTREQALAGEFQLVRKRHITELFRYNQGRWID